MAKWKAPGEIPVVISRMDGHSIWVGSDPVEAPAFFEAELEALGAVRVDNGTTKRRGRPHKTADLLENPATNEPENSSEAESDEPR